MTCRSEISNARTWRFCPDKLPPLADRTQAIMRGRFVDELTGLGMAAQLQLATTIDNITARITDSGIAGLIGNPARRFPGLAISSVLVNMTVSANRYINRRFELPLGPFNTGLGSPANYPQFFSSIDLGDIGMHRQATMIKGRCVRNVGANRVPLAGVTVAINGLWHPFPAADVDPTLAMEAPNIIALRQGLYAPRFAASDVILQRTIAPVAGEEKRLLLDASAGDVEIRISEHLNLNLGDLLAINPNHPDLVEYIQVASIAGASTPNQPATVQLHYPLRKNHRSGEIAVRSTLGVPGANNALLRDAVAADQTLFLSGLAGITNSSIEINNGVGVPEYHAVNVYSVLTDAQGFFRLPPLARVAQAQIRASRADLPQAVTTIYSPDYDLVENRIDVIFG